LLIEHGISLLPFSFSSLLSFFAVFFVDFVAVFFFAAGFFFAVFLGALAALDLHCVAELAV
jgi:hypothetical protein